ncbi:MAG: carboxypeptidase regulatory-like domain-containing protein [Phycisphaerae bacterium]
MTLILLTELVSAPFVWADPPAATQPTEETTVIQGQVFNLFGSGVAGVLVFVTGPADNPEQADKLATDSTDDVGDFELLVPGKLAGQVVIVMQAPGYDTVTRRIQIDPEDELPPFVDVQLKGAHKVAGTVRDARTSKPVPGAAVKVSLAYEQFTAQSDAGGAFQVTGLLPGELKVKVEAPGYATESRSVKLTMDGKNRAAALKLMESDNPHQGQGVALNAAGQLLVSLQPERIVHLVIVDASGDPIGGALVECLEETRTDLRSLVADEQGRVTFRGLHYDTVKLSARLSHESFVSSGEFDRQIELPNDATESTHTLTMQSAGRIVGTVTDKVTGAPLNGARLTVGDASQGRPRRAWTDFEGAFVLEGVSPGKQFVTVHLAGHAPELFDLDVAAGADSTVNVKLGAGRSIQGSVIDEQGKPVPNALIAAQQWRSHASLGLQAMTDGQGRFLLADAPADEFQISILRDGFEPLTDQAVQAPGSEYRFELKAAAPNDSIESRFKVGDQAPALALTTVTGRSIKLADLKGQWVMLDFWATWCGPCLVEIPNLKKVQKTLGTRKDFLLLGISLDQSAGTVRRFVAERKIDWPQSAGPGSGAADVANAYGVSSIPATFLIGPDGKIAEVDLHGPRMSQRLIELLKSGASD